MAGYMKLAGKVRDVHREELHRLMAEIAHADAWGNRKAARFGLCGETRRLMGDLDEFFLWCNDCCMPKRMGGHCMNDWGFLADCSADPESTPAIHLFTFAGGIEGKVPCYSATYERHLNIIFLGPDFRYMERGIESLLMHEYAHWVLHKLFPRENSVSEQYDNIFGHFKELRVRIGPGFLERVLLRRVRIITRLLSLIFIRIDWYLRWRRYFNKAQAKKSRGPKTYGRLC